MPRTRAALCVALFLLTGCGAGWHNVDPAPGSALTPSTQYLIHHGTAVERWHAVRIAADSVSGISWLTPVECDSCRVALPRVEVDSIQLGHPVAGVGKGFALATVAPLLVLALLCTIAGGGCFPSD